MLDSVSIVRNDSVCPGLGALSQYDNFKSDTVNSVEVLSVVPCSTEVTGGRKVVFVVDTSRVRMRWPYEVVQEGERFELHQAPREGAFGDGRYVLIEVRDARFSTDQPKEQQYSLMLLLHVGEDGLIRRTPVLEFKPPLTDPQCCKSLTDWRAAQVRHDRLVRVEEESQATLFFA